ncbi:MAG: 4-alpha-glucanotransferase [Luteolibacter sp.]
MKILFRLNYHTEPGESMWLNLGIIGPDSNMRLNQVLPMRWINHEQWQTEIEIEGNESVELSYHYQFRRESNQVEFNEWGESRKCCIKPDTSDLLFLRDTWRSAGCLDHVFETAAFRTMLPARRNFSKAPPAKNANHAIKLHMAAVPDDLVPCIIGSTSELGDWQWDRAIPMIEVAANRWELHLQLPCDCFIEYKYGIYDPKLDRAVSLEEGGNRVLEWHQLTENQWNEIHDECYRRSASELLRAAGVAIPVFSLRSQQSLGIGEFHDLIPLADWASEVGLKLIQILPINDTSSSHDWTDSYPYSAISAFALHPIYLRLEELPYPIPNSLQNEIDAARDQLNALAQIDYEAVMAVKTQLTREIFKQNQKKITHSRELKQFIAKHQHWLIPYAAFCVFRDQYGTADFSQWRDDSEFSLEKVSAMATPEHPKWPEMAYHIWLQWELDRQLQFVVDHLHSHGLVLKGDLPIGIDRESAAAWSAPELFHMDAQAGAPPDAFAVKGQNWGFPTYNWEAMRKDGYAWWRSRFAHLSRYFDAYRIDHILGFFRIWQIPRDQVEGIMGWFDPAMPISIDEIRTRGIPFDFNRYCRPYIRAHFLHERFGNTLDEALHHYLDDCGHGYFKLRDSVATQRSIVDHFAQRKSKADPSAVPQIDRLCSALLDCASDVLFLEVPGSNGRLFHPRCALQTTRSFAELDPNVKNRLNDLYVDYFYRRQEGFWEARGYEKLPAMRQASPMLLCGEDLGMVPQCVPGVMRELGILSLEIQRMPKASDQPYADPSHAPYLSVVSPSTHDMPTIRGWWQEDAHSAAHFAWNMLGVAFPPHELSGELATRIIHQHLQSPAIWAIIPIQDLLAMDESIRLPDPDAERINIPAITPYYWRYRMHLDLSELAHAKEFNSRLSQLIRSCGRLPN